jgi:hypothetical protein
MEQQGQGHRHPRCRTEPTEREGRLRLALRTPLWDNVLMGWYNADDINVRSRGTFFFILHTNGNYMGRWVGGPTVTGWAAIARARDQAESIITRLQSQGVTVP